MHFRCLPLQLRSGTLPGRHAGQHPVPLCTHGRPCCFWSHAVLHAPPGDKQMTPCWGHRCSLFWGCNAIHDMPPVPAGGWWWAFLPWAWRPAL